MEQGSVSVAIFETPTMEQRQVTVSLHSLLCVMCCARQCLVALNHAVTQVRNVFAPESSFPTLESACRIQCLSSFQRTLSQPQSCLISSGASTVVHTTPPPRHRRCWFVVMVAAGQTTASLFWVWSSWLSFSPSVWVLSCSGRLRPAFRRRCSKLVAKGSTFKEARYEDINAQVRGIRLTAARLALRGPLRTGEQCQICQHHSRPTAGHSPKLAIHPCRFIQHTTTVASNRLLWIRDHRHQSGSRASRPRGAIHGITGYSGS